MWKKLDDDKLDLKKIERCWNSWLSHIKHAGSYHLIIKIYKYLEK